MVIWYVRLGALGSTTVSVTCPQHTRRYPCISPSFAHTAFKPRSLRGKRQAHSQGTPFHVVCTGVRITGAANKATRPRFGYTNYLGLPFRAGPHTRAICSNKFPGHNQAQADTNTGHQGGRPVQPTKGQGQLWFKGNFQQGVFLWAKTKDFENTGPRDLGSTIIWRHRVCSGWPKRATKAICTPSFAIPLRGPNLDF